MANLYDDPKLKATINLDLLNKKSGNQVQNDNLNNFQLSASNTPITPTTPITKDKQSGLGLTGSKTSAVITSDPITGADKKQEIDKVNEDIKKDEEIATLTRDAKIKALKDQLGLSGTSTTAPSLVEQYSKLREEQGVSNLETRLTDINAQIQAKRDEFNKFKRDSEGQGRGITTSIISGQQKKVADQLQTEMDSLAREGEILTNQLNTKNNFISTIMNLTGKDYENAKAEQQQTFDNNYKIQTLYNAQASESQKLASTYLTSLTNLIQNTGVNWDTMDNNTKAIIYQKELEAGWIPGTLESFAKVKPKANLLATIDGYDADGNGIVSLLYADENGNPGIMRTMGTGTKNQTAVKPATAAEETVAGYVARIEQTEPIISGLEDDIAKMGAAKFMTQEALNKVGLASSEFQQFDQASRNFINAVLRRESGSAIADSEFNNAYQQYLPKPGDGEKVLEQKRLNRQIVFQSLKKASGTAYSSVSELLGTGSVYQSKSGKTYNLPN